MLSGQKPKNGASLTLEYNPFLNNVLFSVFFFHSFSHISIFSFSDITRVLCDNMRNGSAAIIYFTNTEKFGSSTAASQYLLQMASFLGMPVIAWNADNSGLEKVNKSAKSKLSWL